MPTWVGRLDAVRPEAETDHSPVQTCWGSTGGWRKYGGLKGEAEFLPRRIFIGNTSHHLLQTR